MPQVLDLETFTEIICTQYFCKTRSYRVSNSELKLIQLELATNFRYVGSKKL